MDDDEQAELLKNTYSLISRAPNLSDYRVNVVRTKAQVLEIAELLKSDRPKGDFTDYRL